MTIIEIPQSKPEELVSAQSIRQYYDARLDDNLDNGSNALVMASGAR